MRCFLTVLFLLLSLETWAQGPWTLTLRWDSQAALNLEGRLGVFTSGGITKYYPPGSAVTKVLKNETTWEFPVPPEEHLKFYVVNLDRNDEFADWASNTWVDWVEVTVSYAGVTRTFKPPVGYGSWWYVLDYLPQNRTAVGAGHILPREGCIFGQITDASTGLPMKGTKVELWDEQGTQVLARDTTDSGGLYLFFPQTDKFLLKIDDGGFILQSETLEIPLGKVPQRRDYNLSRLLNPGEYRIVLSWREFPEDLDLFLMTPQGIKDLELSTRWESKGAIPFGAESLLFRAPPPAGTQLGVEFGEKSGTTGDYLLSYAQPRLWIYSGSRLQAMVRPPYGVKGRVWVPIAFDDQGTISILNNIQD